MKARDVKHFLETLAAVGAVVGPVAGLLITKLGRIDEKLEEHGRQLAVLNFKVLGVVGAETPAGPRLIEPATGRAMRARLAIPSILPFPKPKESPDEK